MEKLRAYLQDESGQTSMEYILLLAVVAMVVFRFRGVFEEKIATLTEDIFDKAGGVVSEIDPSTP